MTILFARPRRALITTAIFAAIGSLSAQPVPPVDQPPQAAAPAPAPDATVVPATPAAALPPGGNRVLGVLPNYRTADKSQEDTTISARHKLLIASKDSFDYPLVGIAAFYAGVGQMTNQNPSFGQGTAGYARRLGTGYVDQAMGNMFTEGLFPALLREDPRYFRRGEGASSHRLGYALSRIFITKSDAGTYRFNYSEWLGNASGVAISNAYYADGRTWNQNGAKLLTQCGTDALSQVLKEFWPDLKRKLTRNKSDSH